MPLRVLHLLSQQPGHTGSGTTLRAVVARAAQAGVEQAALVGLPAEEPMPVITGLAPERLSAVRFGPGGDLPFEIVGMSDVMPYRSRTFSSLTGVEHELYEEVWRAAVAGAVERFRPDVIHANHVWQLSAFARDIAPNIPLAIHCHGTGIRQLALAPQYRDVVTPHCGQAERVFALHRAQKAELCDLLALDDDRVDVVGAGYEESIFEHGESERSATDVLFAGKIAAAKGLPWLLEAAKELADEQPIHLHIIGGGAGAEFEALQSHMEDLGSVVSYHGRKSQAELAERMRRAAVFVLPSLYEGLPLVLLEAAACGCRIVATDLPAVEELEPCLGDWLLKVETPPRDEGTGELVPDPLAGPRFTASLAAGIREALRLGPVPPDPIRLKPFSWDGVFERIHAGWKSIA